MRIGIIIAMEKEFRQIAALLDNKTELHSELFDYVSGNIGEKEIILQRCGIGKVNAAVGTADMIIGYHPQLVISTGCAGASSPDVDVRDVVVGSTVAFHDVYCGPNNAYGQMQDMPPYYNAPRELVEKALAISPRVKEGLIASGDWFVDSLDKTKEILSHFPEAIAVDMESGSIAQTCYLFKVPFISFRVISDNALKENNIQDYQKFWSELADESFDIVKAFI
ncbi:MAG: 5'-methylthioadenosine/adenosylhomocysteine nucleosidase [Bacteroidaceae bacterium]|jgi:adenosylhomocysteine nucleosidase|nr:5'-methylthioadenosine/adenosylhomocysteine nucleosidase [Bacteroidaceae bacterium]